MRKNLDGEWAWFQRGLSDGERMLEEHKEKFKNNLILASEELKKKIQTALEEFNTTGHTFSLHISIFHTLLCLIIKCFITMSNLFIVSLEKDTSNLCLSLKISDSRAVHRISDVTDWETYLDSFPAPPTSSSLTPLHRLISIQLLLAPVFFSLFFLDTNMFPFLLDLASIRVYSH